MTAPTGQRRAIEDVDRDIATTRSARGRYRIQIASHLTAIAVLRTKHARTEKDIDVLLDERLSLLDHPPTPQEDTP